jgi:hypothetical protein
MSNPFDESDDDAEPSERAEGLIINKNFAEKFHVQKTFWRPTMKAIQKVKMTKGN